MAKRFHNFEEFILESQKAEEAIMSALNKRIWSEVFTSSYLTEAEKVWFSNFLTENNIPVDIDNINESVWDTIKAGIEKVKDSGTDIGKKISDKIGKAYQGAKQFTAYIGDLIKKSWAKLLDYFKKKFAGVKDIIKKDYKKAVDGKEISEEKLAAELEALGETVDFWTTKVPAKIADTVKGKFANAIVQECLTHNGEILNELCAFDPIKMDEMVMKALNEADDNADANDPENKGEEGGDAAHGDTKGLFGWLNKMAHKISEYPPFKWLHQIKGLAEKGVKGILKKISELTTKLDGPGVYDFAVVSMISAGAIEYFIKHWLAEKLEKGVFGSEPILKFIPMGTTILHTIEWIALIVLIIETIKELTTAGKEGDAAPAH